MFSSDFHEKKNFAYVSDDSRKKKSWVIIFIIFLQCKYKIRNDEWEG